MRIHFEFTSAVAGSASRNEQQQRILEMTVMTASMPVLAHDLGSTPPRFVELPAKLPLLLTAAGALRNAERRIDNNTAHPRAESVADSIERGHERLVELEFFRRSIM
jgi:hypothetical protein